MLANSNSGFFSIVCFFFLLTGSRLEGCEFLHQQSQSRRHARATDAGEGSHQEVRSSGSHFHYSQPKEWGRDYPSCWGLRQSPIDLSSRKIIRLIGHSPLNWKGYETVPKTMTLRNNGHSVQLGASWNDNQQIPFISGGVLEGEYAFAQFHYHWGPHNEVGSEHTIDGRKFPLELHIVHYKKEYGSLSNAMQHEDGLAVIGVLYKIKQEDNEVIGKLQNHVATIEMPDSHVDVQPFPLSDLKVNFQDAYIAYLGSLTTPPCSEVVTWILPNKPDFLSPNQMNLFRSIRLSNDDNHNYRPTMPLNGRTIYFVSNQEKLRNFT